MCRYVFDFLNQIGRYQIRSVITDFHFKQSSKSNKVLHKNDKNGCNSTCELEIIERICSSISGFFIKKVCNVFLSECRLRPFLSEENFLKIVEKNSCSGVKLYPTSGSDIFSLRSVPGQYFKKWTLN